MAVKASPWPLWAKVNIPFINFTKAALFSRSYVWCPKNMQLSFHTPRNGLLFILDALQVDCIRHQQKGIQAWGWSLTSVNRVWTRIPLTLRECKQTLKAKHMLECILSSGKFPEPKPSHTLCFLCCFFSMFEHMARAGPPVFPQLNATSEKPMELNSVCWVWKLFSVAESEKVMRSTSF